MHKLRSAILSAVGLTLALGVSACQSLSYDSQAAYQQQLAIEPRAGTKEAEIQTLQKATALAEGELAWELVRVSNIQRDATSVKWVATTRSLNLNCMADPDGAGSFCTPAS